jgi:hypothetical protein
LFNVPIYFKQGIDFRQGYTENLARHTSPPPTNGITSVSVSEILKSAWAYDRFDTQKVTDVDEKKCDIHWSVKIAIRGVRWDSDYWNGYTTTTSRDLNHGYDSWTVHHPKQAPDFNELRVGEDVCTQDMVCYAPPTAQNPKSTQRSTGGNTKKINDSKINESKMEQHLRLK